MSKTRPLFTVVMPAYGVEKYLAKAVESIESQTFQEWELIIVEDGSPDKTGSLAEKLIKGSVKQEIQGFNMQPEDISGLWIRMIQ